MNKLMGDYIVDASSRRPNEVGLRKIRPLRLQRPNARHWTKYGRRSGCDLNIATALARFDQQLGSSSTEASISPQDALHLKLQKQKNASRRTSPRSTSPSANETTSKTST